MASSRRVQRLLREAERRGRRRDWRWKLANFYARVQQAVLDRLPQAEVVLWEPTQTMRADTAEVYINGERVGAVRELLWHVNPATGEPE